MSHLEVNFTSIHKKVKFFNKKSVQLKTLFQLLYQQPGRWTPQAADHPLQWNIRETIAPNPSVSTGTLHTIKAEKSRSLAKFFTKCSKGFYKSL